MQTHTLPTPAWATQLSINKGNTHSPAPGVAAADYVNTSSSLRITLRVTSPTTISRRFHAVAAIAANQQRRRGAGLLDNDYRQEEAAE